MGSVPSSHLAFAPLASNSWAFARIACVAASLMLMTSESDNDPSHWIAAATSGLHWLESNSGQGDAVAFAVNWTRRSEFLWHGGRTVLSTCGALLMLQVRSRMRGRWAGEAAESEA